MLDADAGYMSRELNTSLPPTTTKLQDSTSRAAAARAPKLWLQRWPQADEMCGSPHARLMIFSRSPRTMCGEWRGRRRDERFQKLGEECIHRQCVHTIGATTSVVLTRSERRLRSGTNNNGNALQPTTSDRHQPNASAVLSLPRCHPLISSLRRPLLLSTPRQTRVPHCSRRSRSSPVVAAARPRPTALARGRALGRGGSGSWAPERRTQACTCCNPARASEGQASEGRIARTREGVVGLP